MKNIVAQIVEQRRLAIEQRSYTFGFRIPEKRTRRINPFMAERGVILEVKRASPSKGGIAPNLDPAETARKYRAAGAKAISCLTEENYFKGSLQDLIDVCNAVPDVAVLRKDFLIDEEEIEIAFRCGADAVLLISGILTLEKMLSMTRKCKELGIRAFVEVRTEEDAEKVLKVKRDYPETVVCGVNSRNLKDFSIDLLVPAMLKKELGGDVVFESGITTEQAAAKVASMGFSGILLGEFAARNPEKAGRFVKAFENGGENLCGKKLIELAEKVNGKKRPLIKICGLTRAEDVLLASLLGSDFVGFIFASGFARNVCGEKFEIIKKILPKIHAMKVAVVTDPDSDEARQAAGLVKSGVLDFIQLHGIDYDDVPDYLRVLPHYFAVTDKQGNIDEITRKLDSYGEPRFLQDSKSQDYGEVAKEHLWLAGGVTAENVRGLCEKYKPELIDVSSGIEDEDKAGIKNEDKMRKFFEEAKSAI